MPYNHCNQCKKRLKNDATEKFCSITCKTAYQTSPEIYCKFCKKTIGISSCNKKQFCNNICVNEYQRQINKIERMCVNCNNLFIVQKSSHRYKLCSIKCEKEYVASDRRNEARMNSLTHNNLKKYGVEFTQSLPEIIQKSQNTKQLKYGDRNYNNINKIKETNLKKYGKEFAMQLDIINNKAIETKLKKYGTLNFNDKSNKTKLEKYGTLNFYNKASKTVKEKYGVDNISQLDSNKKKMSELQKNLFWEKISLGNRLQNKAKPLFTIDELKKSEYKTKYKFQCNTCLVLFSDHLNCGHVPRCPNCYPSSITKPHREILDFIKSIYSEEIQINNRNVLNGFELDIYIPKLKLAIEYNGLYWHGEVSGGKERKYHLTKTIKCEEKDIQLIHIFEDEWFDKQDIIKSKLKHLLGCNNEVIYARKCIISSINFDVKNDFLENNHLQGTDNSSIRLGAFHNNKLVAVMTFGKLRKALGNNKSEEGHYEMYRFCIGNKNVVGIAGKFLNYFIKNHSPKQIVSYSDRRYSNLNKCYLSKIGFNLNSKTEPGYWYFDKTGIRYHRFNFRKDQLSKKLSVFDPDLTEWENMQLNGYDRIWDCGNYKYIWKPPISD